MTSVPNPSNLTGIYTATYDAWNRLAKLEDGMTTVAEYAYDGANRQIVKSVYISGSLDRREHAYYNQRWQALEVRKEVSGTEDPDPLEQYVWHPFYIDAPLLREYDASTSGTQVRHYYTFDGNFNVTALTDNSGTVAERYHYTPYGQMTVLDANFAVDLDGLSDVINPTMFAGRRLDTESGLLYFRNRHSHSPLGNFISRDKILYNGDSMSLFEYVKSDPCSHLDPYGNAILPEGGYKKGSPVCCTLTRKCCNGTYTDKINYACKLGPFNQPVTPGVCCALLLNKRNQFYDSSPSYFDVPIFCDPWVAKSSAANFCGGNSTICQDDLDSYLDALVGGNQNTIIMHCAGLCSCLFGPQTLGMAACLQGFCGAEIPSP
jgi:RHS repeat-associated protein